MTDPSTARSRFEPLREFLRAETTGAAVLLAATAAALVWANGPFADAYGSVWDAELGVRVGGRSFALDLRHWVNDGLMTIFFLVVGLEIKRELVDGELRDPAAAAVPLVAAIGGMVVPAAIYLAINPAGPASRGWGIPMATDIAFAIGVLALVGRRAPAGLRLFLLTLAIVDDIGAIGVIAVAYTDDVAWRGLVVAAAGFAAVLLLRRARVPSPVAYIVPGLVVWAGLVASGVHPTLGAVVLGLTTPAAPVRGREVLEELEHRLHPVSSLVVVPVFALANAGVGLGGDALAGSPVLAGVALGLVAGKIVGIAGATALAVRLTRARLPAGVTLRHVTGAAALGGIGFTVSLFITELAFGPTDLADQAKLGVLVASAASAAIGWILLRLAPRH